MHFANFSEWIAASLLLSLRVAPVFALAEPFTLIRAPGVVRVLMGLGLSANLAAAFPTLVALPSLDLAVLLPVALRELFLGSIFVLAFQLMFAAIYLAGRTVDIQAGFGLSAVVDPTTKAQTPLFGSLYAYLAGAIFLGMGGHLDLARILSASLQAIPLGQAVLPNSLGPLTAFVGAVFVTGLGVAGGAILALFLADISIALLSRTAPQLNVLVLGFQVKTLLLLVVTPLTLGISAALLARMASTTLETIPTLFG